MRICIQAEARALHWATASTVFIIGATPDSISGDSISGIINGAFEVAEWPDNEPPIYRRADGRDGWLYVDSEGKWAIGSEKDKDALGLWSWAYAYSVEEAQGRLPHEVGLTRTVYDENARGWFEQPLRVLHGEAEVLVVCHTLWISYPADLKPCLSY